MTILLSTDLVKLRSHPHVARFYMSILRPTLIYTGQVTGSPAYGARLISLTTISGSLSSLEEGCTLKVKDASGNLVSKRRYRETIGSAIKIDENTITWSNTYTIEAYNQFELWSKYPYIDEDDNYKFYKDYDIAYVDQNIRIPPVAIMGSNQAGFLEDGSITFTLDARQSYGMPLSVTGVRIPISSYKWTCSTGTIVDDTDNITSITFTTPGYHIVKLEITDLTHSTQFTRRVFFVHERTGVHSPFINFDVDSMQCNWSDGGCTMTATLRGDDRIIDIEDNALVILWSENWYSGVKQNIGIHNNIRFVGYITSETIQRSTNSNDVSFEVGTIDSLLKNMSMFSISLQTDPATPTDSSDFTSSYFAWYIYPPKTLTVTNALHHLWKWHSTLLEIADVLLPIENTYRMTACDDMTDGNLFTLADWVYDNGIFAKAYCDQVGIFHVDVDSLVLSKSDRDDLDVYMDITTQDWRLESGIQIDRRKDTQAGLVVVSGIAYVGTEYVPLMAQAPGAIPSNFGSDTINVERLVLESQAQLNMLAGRLYAVANSDISEIRLEFSGDYPILMSPKVWYTLTIPASYTDRGIDIDVRMQCRSITYNISMSSGVIYPSCVFEVDVESLDGITITYPSETETAYAPVPAYTPTIPYVPDVPVIYPVVSSSPYPNYPGGAPTTVVPSAVTIPLIDPICRTHTSYSPNGPYNIYSGSIYGGSTIIPIKFFLRGTNYTNVTKYTVNGYFYKVNDDTGEYEETLDDDMYEIYALDAAGERVAMGIKDAVVGNGYQRTGQFNAPAGINVSSIELEFIATAILSSHSENNVIDSVTGISGVYSHITDPGVSSFLILPDNTLVQQLDKAVLQISNPPWSGDATIIIQHQTAWNVEHASRWFDILMMITTSYYLGSPNLEVKESFWYGGSNILIASSTYQLTTTRVRCSPSIIYPDRDVGITLKGSITFNNEHEDWMTLFTTIKPISAHVDIDSLLLWNVCSHS